MKNIILYALLALAVTGCAPEKIEITTEYIINENWSKKNDVVGGNAIKIEKMKVRKDSIVDSPSALNKILDKLEEDSTFRWYANARTDGKSYKGKKIYFNKDNGFMWLDDVQKRRTPIFGNLEKGNWYKFSHLKTHPFFIYIYIDSSNTVHRYDDMPANF